MLSPESALQYWRFDLDHLSGCQLLFDFAERYVRAGNVVWDIGANCGVFSVAASGLAGREGLVVALEPDRFLSGLLFRSASARSAEAAPIEVLCCAASDRTGTAVLNIARRGRSTNFLSTVAGRSDSGGVRESERVMVASLDSLLADLPGPQVLKIDVEGAEALVIRGAQHLLTHVRPTILCEVGDDTRREVIETLSACDYGIVDGEPGSDSRSVMESTNLIGIPRR